jgi:hypothetical protein
MQWLRSRNDPLDDTIATYIENEAVEPPHYT